MGKQWIKGTELATAAAWPASVLLVSHPACSTGFQHPGFRQPWVVDISSAEPAHPSHTHLDEQVQRRPHPRHLARLDGTPRLGTQRIQRRKLEAVEAGLQAGQHGGGKGA